MGEEMDQRALKILFDRYWCSSGWKADKDQKTSPKDMTYAKSAGMMFDPMEVSHADVVKRVIAVIKKLSPQRVADGFLASLSTRRLDLRSALGSFAIHQFLSPHTFTTSTDPYCTICGATNPKRGEDLNVLNFERHKWGGVRHDQPIYALFDLEQFRKSKIPTPTAEDLQIFRDLIDVIRNVPPSTSSAKLPKCLGSAGFKSSKPEREVIVQILGFCGILDAPAHPGYSKQFIPYSKRDEPATGEMPYPVSWWRAKNGVNDKALQAFFGHVL